MLQALSYNVSKKNYLLSISTARFNTCISLSIIGTGYHFNILRQILPNENELDSVNEVQEEDAIHF